MCSLGKLDENIYINDRRIKRHKKDVRWKKSEKAMERRKKISLSKNKQKGEKKIKIQRTRSLNEKFCRRYILGQHDDDKHENTEYILRCKRCKSRVKFQDSTAEYKNGNTDIEECLIRL